METCAVVLTSHQLANGSASSGKLRVRSIDFRNDARIIPFLSSHPGALIYHHPGWLNALQEESGQECWMLACECDDGSLWGIMPLAYTRGLPFNVADHQTKRRISSLPRTPFVGPLSTNSEATKLLLGAAIKLAETENMQLQVKTESPLPHGIHDHLICAEWRPTYVLALPKSREQLRFGDAKSRHRLRWGVKKATKLGLVVRPAETESDLEAWYTLYLTTMRRNFVPPRSYKLFLSLWRDFRKCGSMRLLLAEQINATGRTLIAGSVFLMKGKTVFYAFTGSLTQHLSMHANDIILWEAIHRACHDGYKLFDFGEVAEEHPELVRFKTKWGSTPKPLYRHYYPCPPQTAIRPTRRRLREALSHVWQYVPLSMTARIGEWLYGYL
jgi:hypothetical protein